MKQTGKKSICWIFDHNVQTENVKISELHDFQGHPFKVGMICSFLNYQKVLRIRACLFP